jgi:thiol:disulfide interchange protein DsbD
MTARHLPFLLVLAAVATAGADAGDQTDPLVFEVSVLPADPFHPMNQAGAKPAPMKIRRGQVVKLVIEGKLKPGYHTYPLTMRTARQEAAMVSKIKYEDAPGLAVLWPVIESAPDLVDEEIEPKKTVTNLEHTKDFSWSQDVLVLPDAKPGQLVLPFAVRGMVCDEKGCVPVHQDLKATFDVSAEEPLAVDAALDARRKESMPPPSVVIIPGQEEVPANNNVQPAPVANVGKAAAEKEQIFSLLNSSAADYQQQMEALASRIHAKNAGPVHADLWAFVLAGIFWGAVSLVTPCVFPMIPITVSFFLKQSEKEHHKPMAMALVYSGTIVIVLTLAAAFLLSVFRMLSINPIMNYGLGALFIIFALSLFGMYDIELPSGLARFTSSREGQGGVIGTIFMALTFTIISFACVAPFLGGFGGTSAGTARPWWHNILGGLAFSATFAAPFFFLALFPTLLRKMPKSGSWLNSVKVVMGFLELAAAFGFFRTAELVLTGSDPWLFTFDFVMGIYVALSFLCGLYLLGVYRLPHDSPQEHISVPRLLFSALFICFGFYLLPSVFKTPSNGAQRPTGTIYAWVEAFLLPDGRAPAESAHTANLPAAVAEARAQRQKSGQPKRIFVDFTGVTCKNCRQNEQHVFPKPSIHKLFEPYLIVKLYTDTVPKEYYAAEVQSELKRSAARQESDADVNLKFQRRLFGTEQLPLYVILEAQLDETVIAVAVYDEGRINNEGAFAEFLRGAN